MSDTVRTGFTGHKLEIVGRGGAGTCYYRLDGIPLQSRAGTLRAGVGEPTILTVELLIASVTTVADDNPGDDGPGTFVLRDTGPGRGGT